MKIKHLCFLCFCLVVSLTSGCAAIEKVFLVPEKYAEISYDSNLTNKEVLDAIAAAVEDVNAPAWKNNITYLNVSEGLLETGDFRKSNISDIRIQAKIKIDKKLIFIIAKGVGPYYSKVPIEDALKTFTKTLTLRLLKVAERHKYRTTGADNTTSYKRE